MFAYVNTRNWKTGVRAFSAFLSIALALVLLVGCGGGEETADTRTSTQQVVRGNLVLGLGADGRVALPVSNMNFGVSGTVSKIHVSVGDSVKAGDLLAELDDSSYQFAISNARNNLTKAQIAYDNAVSQYEYTVLSDEKDMNKIQQTLRGGFDDYTYQNSITDARLSLERRMDDLEKAEQKAKSPFDPYTYDNQIAEAERALAARQKDINEAEAALLADFDDYAHQNSITEAYINVDRRQSALRDADNEISFFDSTQYNSAIVNAQAAYNQANAAYNDALREYNEAVQNADGGDPGSNAAIADALRALETAKTQRDNAQTSLDNARQSLANAQNSYSSTTYSKIDSAQQALDDARRQLDKAQNDLARAVSQDEDNKARAYETAKDAYDSAVANLEKLKADKARAASQAEQDAADQLKNAAQAVTDAQTSLERAITNLARARADFDKQSAETRVDLQLKGINSDMNKNSNASVSNAEFVLEEAKLSLEETENELEQVKLYAPIDGQVLSISKSAGESVSAQSTGGPPGGIMIFGTGDSGANFMTVCDVTKIYLTASITEGDIVSVSKDQIIQVTIDAIGDEVFYGVVTNIDNIPTTDANGITTYRVTCLLDETSEIIKDGMNAYITFVRRENKDVLLIPNRAVFIEDELQYVNVVKADGSHEKRKVVCGLSNGVQTEVASGLEQGETVVVGRQNR